MDVRDTQHPSHEENVVGSSYVMLERNISLVIADAPQPRDKG